jgi:sec-independent protein translocase protein TatC
MSSQETFISHLIELRERLIRALASILLVMLVLMFWPGMDAVYDFVAAPLGATKGIATGIITAFTVPLKVTALVAFMVALPYVLYQVWAFVAPGLYEHEKKLALPLVVASSALFYLGVAFCYYFVLGRVFEFVASFAPKSITPMPDVEKYVSFVLTMFLAFGITFEIPVAVVILVRAGIVDVAKLVEIRPYVILGNAVVAAVVTPPDAVSMLALLLPMCVLYEVGIFFSRFITARSKDVPQDSTDPAH